MALIRAEMAIANSRMHCFVGVLQVRILPWRPLDPASPPNVLECIYLVTTT